MGHSPNIPLTPQTDERNFPKCDFKAPYGQSGHPYPKMLNREFMPEDVEAWQQANIRQDRFNGPYYETRCPRARRVLANGKVIPGEFVAVLSNEDLVAAGYAQTVGEPVICQNAKDEADIRVILGMKTLEDEAKSVTTLMQPDHTEAELQRLRRQNEELESLLERNVKLNRKIAEAKEERAEVKQEAKREKIFAKQPPEPVKKARGRPKGSKNKKVITSLEAFAEGEEA